MPPEKVRPPAANRGAEDEAPDGGLSCATLLASTGIEAACAAYVVLLVNPTGKYVRRVYLSLHSSQAALRRAQERGQPAHLVLCRLTPEPSHDLAAGQWSE